MPHDGPKPVNHFYTAYTPPLIDGDFEGKHIISVDQFARHDLEILFDAARSIRRRISQQDRGLKEICAGKVMASLFFEASTRTDMSFQAAMRRLGGDVISASNGVQFSSMYKGENIADTIRAAGCYADAIVMRHDQEGSTYEAAFYLDRLNRQIKNRAILISGGDGVGEHPTQALLDLFTIFDRKQGIDHLTLTMVGDLKHGRTVHSLAKLIACYRPAGVTLCLVSPESLRMPAPIVALLRAAGLSVIETTDLMQVLPDSDVMYWTRVQEERFSQPDEYERIKDGFVMLPAVLARAPARMILMHPLPRKHEMGTQADHDILDEDPRAIYFEQMENGMFVRMALLAKVLRGAYV
ncbi:MAG: aspartate carbamoyltransferase [Anaerolineae bacterium]|jgi:aspartate carbamoyltransferase|nr:aspartate carbamoyltransferase [Anaerolineae bacterium]